MKSIVSAGLLAAALSLAGAPAQAVTHAAPEAVCAPGALGTVRTLTLKREHVGYGRVQYGALPLAQGEVVLTFDDGPVPELLPRVLDALAAECARATFFMTGANIAKHPALARRVAAAGHTTALHSYAHPHLGQMTQADQLADLERAIRAYVDALGSQPAAYRFPYLGESPVTLAALKERKMTVASVDLGIDDWAPNDMSRDALVKRLVTRLKETGGGIILMHDANQPTVEALPALLAAIKEQGYKVVHLRWEDAAAR